MPWHVQLPGTRNQALHTYSPRHHRVRKDCGLLTSRACHRGDFFNRGAWYDTLLADSIPVVFEAGYDGTLPFREVVDYQRIMQLVPLERIIGDSAENALDILKADFDAHTALDRLKYIREVKHLFQYMLNPLHELIRMDQIGMIAQEDDAFTMTVKSALTNMCQRGLLPSVRCTAGRVPPRT